MKMTNIIHKLYYDRNVVSKGINVNKTTKSKDCDICLYCYFFNKGLKFQSYLCNRCQYVLIMSTKLQENFKNADYCIINGISKSKGLKLFQNIDLTEKVEPCKK